MQVCRKCGAMLRDGDKFCSKCGARVPKGDAQARREQARKKKQSKEINFRTKPAGRTNYRENFEEGESRSRALLVTVTVLVAMLLAVVLFATVFFLSGKGRRSGASWSGAIEILSEGQVVQSEPSEAQPQEEGGAEAQGQGSQDDASASAPDGAEGTAQGEASGTGAENAEGTAQGEAAGTAQDEGGDASPEGQEPETEPAAETETVQETEPVTEPVTEPATERVTPAAADVIDPAVLQELVDNGSTAYVSEVYVYDLKHDSEASLNDCTEPMYASALITVPILYTAASLIDDGELTLDTPVTYVTSIGGRGEMTTEPRDGLEFPLSFYLQTMTGYSDNNCINVLIDFLGLDRINEVCAAAGYTSVNMERGIVAANPGGLDNYVSAKDLTMMVKDLYTGRFASVGTDFMQQYFRISEADSLPTLIGRADSLGDAVWMLNQNGHGETRYNETAVIEDGGAQYILTIMLYGDMGLAYDSAVINIAEYVNEVMTQ